VARTTNGVAVVRRSIKHAINKHGRGLGVWAVATVLVLLRQPHALTRPQFVWEETAAFWAASFILDPMVYLFEPWSGYLIVPVRAAFLVSRLGPPEIAPAVTIMIHAAVIGIVASFLSSNRLAVAIPDGRVRLLFALSIAVLPLISPYLSVSSGQWFFAIALAGMSLTKAKSWDYPLLLVAGLSGLAPLLTLPLFWRAWRPWRADQIDPRGLLLLGLTVVQVVSLAVYGSRAMVFATAPVLVTLIVMMIAAFVAARALPRPTQLAFGYLALVTFVLGLFTMGMWGRYFLALWAFVALAALAGLRDRRLIGVALATWFVVVAGGTFLAAVPPDVAWAANARCIGSHERCVVPADPPQWSVTWPGDANLYVLPSDWMLPTVPET
jgi:hypothetical protein